MNFRQIESFFRYEIKYSEGQLKNEEKNQLHNHSPPDAIADIEASSGQLSAPRGKKIGRFLSFKVGKDLVSRFK